MASALLAAELGISLLLLSTGVEKVAVRFRKPGQRNLERITADEAPVVLGSLHAKMIALAAGETAGVLTYLTSPEKTAQIRAGIGPRKWLCAAQPVLLERDPGRARAAARAYMSLYLRIPHYSTMLAAPRRTLCPDYAVAES